MQVHPLRHERRLAVLGGRSQQLDPAMSTLGTCEIEDYGHEIDRLTKGLEAELISFRRDLRAHPELARGSFGRPRRWPSDSGRQASSHASCRAARDWSATSSARPARYRPSGSAAISTRCRSTTGRPTDYRSRTPGVCHACGHDAHTTVVLGTALVLAELARAGLLAGSARVIFQPAEEIIPGGALDVLSAGETLGLEHVFAFHCEPRLEVGRVGLREGAITAGADGIKVTLTGPGGHTARPHLTADLVYALGCLVTELPGALSRLTDPRAGLSVVWGQVHAGTAANAIPSAGFVEGTVRCLDADVWAQTHSRVPDLIRSLMSPFGVEVHIDGHTSVPPCVNDPAAIELARSAALDVVGVTGVATSQQSLGAEDFSWIANAVPSALLRLGVRGPGVAEAGDLHQGSFDIDEAAIAVGVRIFSRLGLRQTED